VSGSIFISRTGSGSDSGAIFLEFEEDIFNEIFLSIILLSTPKDRVIFELVIKITQKIVKNNSNQAKYVKLKSGLSCKMIKNCRIDNQGQMHLFRSLKGK
jgi:hypothetical protein